LFDAPVITRKATIADAPTIHRLINGYARQGLMLGRALSEIYEHIRDFTVCEVEGQVAGCVALSISWSNLGEVRSLAVAPEHQGRGLGKTLVETCLSEARAMGLPRLFTLTYIPEFFERLGYARVDKHELPQKIWGDCLKCPHFPDCNEVPLARDVP
jgi:amino-acid N-acetyltransferase